MSQAHTILQALYRQIHRPSQAPASVATLARATSLPYVDVRQNVLALAQGRFVERGANGAIRLTLAGLAVAVAKVDPHPAPAIRETRRVACAA
jgi:DNA-binding IclR family transcriptional regulator